MQSLYFSTLKEVFAVCFTSPVKMLSRTVSDLEAGCNLLAGALLLQDSALISVILSSTLTFPYFNDQPFLQTASISEQCCVLQRINGC